MDWHHTREFLSPCLPEPLRSELMLLEPGELQEIRIRADRPTVFVTASRSVALDWQPGPNQLASVVEALSGHSLHARIAETSHGYLTLPGGHRMGLCGRITHRSGQPVLSDVGSVCIRIAGEWPGTADPVIPFLLSSGKVASCLVIGPPGSGKTTLLRDIARQLSAGSSMRQVCIIDERGELAACLHGVPQLDIGSADVLDGLSKAEAMPWLVRSMSPQLIVTDELNGDADVSCVLDTAGCGIAICASVHGESLAQAATRPSIANLMARRVFDLYVVLSPGGCTKFLSLHDRSGQPLPMA